MGEQIIRQPDGRFAVFSTGVDDFVITDATPPEIVAWRMKRAAVLARLDTIAELAAVQSAAKRLNPQPYYQFTLTWDEAVTKAGHDPMTDDKEDKTSG